MLKKLKIFIFSYNRGHFLQNCLDSVEKCAGSYPVFILDDNSNDPKTQEILKTAALKHHVFIAGTRSKSEFKTGGLYSNMSYAIDCASADKFEYALFLQDDQQLVRPILDEDLENMEIFFRTNKNSFQLYACFLKKAYLKYDKIRMEIDVSRKTFLRTDIGTGGLSHFSAAGIFKVDRFYSLYGKFEIGELPNDFKAKSKFIQMGFYRYPFMMWLPFPMSHRGKNRTLYRKMIEKYGKSGLYPFDYMSDQDIICLFQAKDYELPVAEHYLRCPKVPKNLYWSTTGGHSNLIALGGIYRLAGRVLAKIMRLKKQVRNKIC